MNRHLFTITVLFFCSSLWGCGATPSQPAAQNMLPVSIGDGESAIEQGDYDGAAEIFAQLINETPNDAILHYYYGLAKNNSGDTATAISEYQKALQLNPELTSAEVNLGLVYFDQGNFTNAIEVFESAAQKEPEAADIQYNLAMALAAAGRTDEAVTHYEKCASLDASDPDPIIALGDLEKAAGRFDSALSFYDKAASIGSGSGVAVLSAAQLLKDQNKNVQAAQKLLSLVNMDADGETLATAGLMLSKMNKPDDAITIYRHAIDVAPESIQAKMLLGNALARKGEYAEAAVQFQQILDSAPEGAGASAAQKALAACQAKLTP